jgi:hypothetical protein
MATLRDKLKQYSNLRNVTENQPQFVAPALEESSHSSSSREIEESEEEESVVSVKDGGDENTHDKDFPEDSQKKDVDGVDQKIIDDVVGGGGGKGTAEEENPKEETTEPDESAAAAAEEALAPDPASDDSKLTLEEEDIASQYRKMLKMGMPIGAVEQKMNVDGVDQKIIDSVVAGDGDEEENSGDDAAESAPTVAAAADTASLDTPQQVYDGDGVDQLGAGAEGEEKIEESETGGAPVAAGAAGATIAAVLEMAPTAGDGDGVEICANDEVPEEEIFFDSQNVDDFDDSGGGRLIPDDMGGEDDIESGMQTQSRQPSPSKMEDKERRRKGFQFIVALICLIALGAGLPFLVPWINNDDDTSTTVQSTSGSPTLVPVSPEPTASSEPTLTPNPMTVTAEPTQVPTETVAETPAPTSSRVTPSPTAALLTPAPTVMSVTPAPTATPTAAPVTPDPTAAPTTPAPTDTPTAAPVTPAPTDMPVTPSPTDIPTAMPVTPAPTDAPTTLAPTVMPITPAPTDAPTAMPVITPAPSPAPSNGRFTSFVEQLETISGEGAFENTSSPQYQALQFLIGEGYTDAEVDVGVLERYAALTFYYATGGDSSWYQCFRGHLNCGSGQWLLGDVCGWQYISCNSNGFVTSLKFGTLDCSYKPNFVSFPVLRISFLISTVSDNGLAGSIPLEVWAFEFLEEFVLVGSNLEGSLPEKLGETASNMRILRFENSGLSGTIANGFLSNSPVESLVLAGNKLTGSIPETIYSLTDLQQLYLNENAGLTGRLSPSIGNLADLIELRVSNTQVGGLIPDEIFELTAIEEIDLSRSQFRGPISSAFASLSDTINRLYLDNNQFMGTVPGDFGLLTNLQELTLHENMMTGSISSTICNLRTDDLRVLTVDCDEVSCSCCSTCF